MRSLQRRTALSAYRSGGAFVTLTPEVQLDMDEIADPIWLPVTWRIRTERDDCGELLLPEHR